MKPDPILTALSVSLSRQAWTTGECQIFCVWLIRSMLPERSKDDDNFQRFA